MLADRFGTGMAGLFVLAQSRRFRSRGLGLGVCGLGVGGLGFVVCPFGIERFRV